MLNIDQQFRMQLRFLWYFHGSMGIDSLDRVGCLIATYLRSACLQPKKEGFTLHRIVGWHLLLNRHFVGIQRTDKPCCSCVVVKKSRVYS